MPLRLDVGDPCLAEPLASGSPEWPVLVGEDRWEGPETLTLLAACSSTLDVAWRLLARGEMRPWDAVLCGRQWAGRGQLRRAWTSPLGNLHAAVRLPALPPAWAPLVSLLVGYGVRQGLGVEALRLKWPNDLLLEGRKVGGILIEERDGVLVAGIGINLATAPESLRDGAATPAGVLPQSSQPVLAVWARLVRGLRLCYETLPASMAPSAWCDLLAPLLAWRGRWVEAVDHRLSVAGVLRGVAEDGALVLQGPGGETIRVEGGSLRPLAAFP